MGTLHDREAGEVLGPVSYTHLDVYKRQPQTFANECMRVLKKNGKVMIAEPFFSPVVRWIANTVVFPFSRTGDVRVYSQKELRLFFESAGFTDIESYTTGTVLFFSATK